jgi:hypothetical protein
MPWSRDEPSIQDSLGTLFSLPGVDDPPLTEIGVILMGLETDRLLTGLGAAAETDDDPARVTLLVDQLRHGARPGLTDALAAGARRWRSARPALAAADPGGPPQTAAIRTLWTKTLGTVTAARVGPPGAAGQAYLAACWLRRTDVDRFLEDRHGVPELPA